MAVFRVQTAYRQFYLFDEVESPLYPEEIDEADIRCGAKALPFLLAIYSRSQAEAELSVTTDGFAFSADDWEHIVEAPLEVPSGTLLLATPETYLPQAQRISMAPGTYRVSIASRAARPGTPEQFAVHFVLSSPSPIKLVKDGRLHAP